jgi:DnaJ-class molecular chaperone
MAQEIKRNIKADTKGEGKVCHVCNGTKLMKAVTDGGAFRKVPCSYCAGKGQTMGTK